MSRRFLPLFVLLIMTSCALAPMEDSHSHMDHSGQVIPTSRTVFPTSIEGLPLAKPTEIVELNDGDSYSLTAQAVVKEINGQKIRMLAYNGSIPGPTLKVQQGSTIRVFFKNELDIPTSIHSHGLRLKNAFDGSHLVQNAIAPGDVFEYELTFPDPGMHWYHPHLREDYAQELGLYGNYWVVPEQKEYWSAVNREIPLMIDDLLIEGGTTPFFEEFASHALMGRFGNTMLVNGSTDFSLKVHSGEVIRFFITNSANTRPFRLAIPGVNMKLVGGDSGAYEQESFVENVTISPSERVVIEAFFPKAGTFELVNHTPAEKTSLAGITVETTTASPTFASSFGVLRENASISREMEPFKSLVQNEPDKYLNTHIHLEQGHMMHHGSEKIEWEDSMPEMNKALTSDEVRWELEEPSTEKANMEIDDWKFKVGEKVKIRLFNDPHSDHPMHHPIHIHGQRILVVSINGIPQDNLVWKDTVLVQTGDTVDVIVEMSNPGVWMIHCHIAEHLESGMMMKFEVL